MKGTTASGSRERGEAVVLSQTSTPVLQFQLYGTNKKDHQGLGWKVCSSHRSPLTHTAHTSGVQLEVLWTVAEVAARGVDTQAVDAVHGVCTFVDV